MTTEQIQGVLSYERDFNQASDLRDWNKALWEIALQLSILNSHKDPKDSADELTYVPTAQVDVTKEPFRAEPFRGRVIEALFRSVPNGNISTIHTQRVVDEIVRLKKIERRYQKLVVKI